MALCVQADVESFLQPKTALPHADPTIAYMIENAQAQIESVAGRRFDQDDVTEALEADWTDELWLSRWPVTAVASVTEDGIALSTPDHYRWYRSGRVFRIGGIWSVEPQAIEISYTGGYLTADVPHELRDLCARLAARSFRAFAKPAAGEPPLDPVVQEALDDYSATYDRGRSVSAVDVIMTDEERAIARRYSRRSLSVRIR